MDDLPSWLQAFAAIVALGLSVWAVLHTGSQEKRRELLRRKALAVAIYPELLKLPIFTDTTRRTLARIKENAGALVGQSVAGHLQFQTVAVPPMLERNIDNLYLLGEPAGPSCLQLVSLLWQYNETVDSIAARTVSLGAAQWGEGVAHLEDHLTLIDAVAIKCAEEVKPTHDAVKV